MESLEKLSDVELLQHLSNFARHNLLLQYKPYPWQKEFHNAGRFAAERMTMCANGCITPWTRIETVPQSRPIVEMLGSGGFDVRSWAGGSECVRPAHGVFLKSIEPAFRLHLDNGEWFDCSRTHRVLTDEGWLSLDQLVHASSGQRLRQTIADFQASCAAGGYRDDAPLPMASGSDVVAPPSAGGAHRRSPLIFSQVGAAARIGSHIRVYPSADRLSIDETSSRSAGLCAMFPDPEPCIDALWLALSPPETLRIPPGLLRPESCLAGDRHQSFEDAREEPENVDRDDACRRIARALEHQSQMRQISPFVRGQAPQQFLDESGHISILFPSEHPGLAGGASIVAIVPLGWQPILDFTVPGTECYVASGVVHHNTGKTHGASAELAMHATGIYPDWWEGMRYENGGFECWVGSIDSDMQKFGVQRALLGRDLDELLGTGWLPKHTIQGFTRRQAATTDVIDMITVKHVSGEPVMIRFKSYEQGWRKWQSGDPRVILMDEEPDENVVDQAPLFGEIQTRMVRNAGILMVAYTPLLGETTLTDHFMNPKAPGIFYVSASWDDAPHLREEDKARLRATYPAHELEARTMGVPMMGEGRIFSESETSITVDPFEIPKHWARVCGVDFGLDHPAACAWLAIDRDTDTIYLYDVWKKRGVTTADHAAAIRSRGTWIPVAWPHDGEQRDRDAKVRVADKYRRTHDVNMLTYSARYENERGGAQAQWPIIEEVQERLKNGRLKVFRTCKDWLQEYRSYHLKDGKIVSRRDDALKASFYALMMRRYAVSEFRATRARSAQARMPMPMRM